MTQRVMVGRMPWDYAAVEPLPVGQYLRSPTELALAMLQQNVEAFARRVESSLLTSSTEPGQTLADGVPALYGDEWTRLLRTFRRLAAHNTEALSNFLFAWYHESPAAGVETVPRVRAFLFASLLLTTLQACQAAPCSAQWVHDIIQACCDFFLAAPDKDPEGEAQRRETAEIFARLLGSLSAHALHHVTQSMLATLSDKVAEGATADVVALLRGMHFLRFPLTQSGLAAALRDFVGRVLALATSKKAKSEQNAAAYRMVGAVLIPLGGQELPVEQDNATFRHWVTELFHEHRKAWKKLKDPSAGLLMEVGILCNGEKSFFASQPFSVFERLGKLTKPGDRLRLEALSSLFYLLLSLLSRYRPVGDGIDLQLILDKVALDIFPSSTSKKALAPHLAAVSTLADVATLISVVRLEYALQHFLLALLAQPSSEYFERLFVALLFFQSMTDRMSLSFVINDQPSPHDPSNVSQERRRSIQLLARHPRSPSAVVSSSQLTAIRETLGDLLIHLDGQVGDQLTFRRSEGGPLPSMGSDSVKNAKDRPIYLHLLKEALLTAFRVPPANMSLRRFLGLVTKWSFHGDGEISAAATNLLRGLLTTRPTFRSLLVGEHALFLLSIPDSEMLVLHRALDFFKELLDIWLDPAVLHRLDPDVESYGEPSERNAPFPVATLEALGLLLLCNRNSAIRSGAYSFLHSVQALNDALPESVRSPVASLWSTIQNHEAAILAHIAMDYTSLSIDYRPPPAVVRRAKERPRAAVEVRLSGMESDHAPQYDSLLHALTSMHLGEAQTLICRCVGEMCHLARGEVNPSLQMAFEFAWAKGERLMPILTASGGKRTNPPPGTPDPLLETACLWRNFLTVMLSAGAGLDHNIVNVLERALPLVMSPHHIVRSSLRQALQYCCRGGLFRMCDTLLRLPEESGKKRDLARFEVARIFRSAPSLFDHFFFRRHPDTVERYLAFVKEGMAYLQAQTLPSSQGFYGDVPPVQTVLCFSCDLFRSASSLLRGVFQVKEDCRDLAICEPSVEFREALLTLALHRCGYGPWRGENEAREAKVREAVQAGAGEEAWTECQNEILCTRYWAICLIGELLRYDATAFSNQEIFTDMGPIFAVAEDVFRSAQDSPSLIQVTQRMLEHFVCYQGERRSFLLHICTERSFLDSHAHVSSGLFSSLVAALQRDSDVDFSVVQLLALGLYKLTDPLQPARRSAVELLHWLSERFFRNWADTFQLTSYTVIPSACRTQQESITKSFATAHPEICGELLQSLLGFLSHLGAEPVARMLRLIAFCFAHLDLRQTDDNLDWIMHNLTLLTHKFAAATPDIFRLLWHGMAQEESNIPHLLSYLLRVYAARPHPALLHAVQSIAVYLFECHPVTVVRCVVEALESRPVAAPRYQRPAPQVLSPDNEWDFGSLFPLSEDPLPLRSVALFLLPELAGLHVNPFRESLVLLLQTAVTEMDSRHALVRHNAKQLLLNLTTGIVIANHLDGLTGTPQGLQAQQAVQDLLAIYAAKPDDDAALWQREDISLLHSDLASSQMLGRVVQLVLQCLSPVFKSLREDWSQLTLEWATGSRDDHTVSRSLQLYRALESSLSKQHLLRLSEKLVTWVQQRTGSDICISAEIMLTLRTNSQFTARRALHRMPQMYWLAVAMLNTIIPEEFSVAVRLLSSLIDDMQVQSEGVYSALLCTEPQCWQPVPYQGLFVCLLKGMCSRKTEPVTRQLFKRLAMSPCSQLLHKDEELRFLLPLLALLPSLVTLMGKEDSVEISEKLAGAFLLWPQHDFVRLFTSYPMYVTSEEGMRRFIHESTSLIATHFLPNHELLLFSVLVELMNNGTPANERSIMRILVALLTHVSWERSPLASTYLPLLATLLPRLESKCWSESLVALETLLLERAQQPPSREELEARQGLFPEALAATRDSQHTWQRLTSVQPLLFALSEALDPTYNQNISQVAVPNEIDIRDQIRSLKQGKEPLHPPPAVGASSGSITSRDRSNSFQKANAPTESGERTSDVAMGATRQGNAPRTRQSMTPRGGRAMQRPGFQTVRSSASNPVVAAQSVRGARGGNFLRRGVASTTSSASVRGGLGQAPAPAVRGAPPSPARGQAGPQFGAGRVPRGAMGTPKLAVGRSLSSLQTRTSQ